MMLLMGVWKDPSPIKIKQGCTELSFQRHNWLLNGWLRCKLTKAKLKVSLT